MTEEKNRTEHRIECMVDCGLLKCEANTNNNTTIFFCFSDKENCVYTN